MTAATLPATSPAQRLGPVTGLRNAFTLTWRSVLKLRTNMEDLVGLSLQPIMFLVLFTYVFGGAIKGGTHAYLQFELPGLRTANLQRGHRSRLESSSFGTMEDVKGCPPVRGLACRRRNGGR